MTLVYLFLAPLAAAILSFALTPVARRLANHIGAVDKPGPRKIHAAPIPRLGGLAVLASCAIVTVWILSFGPPSLFRRLDVDLAVGITIGLLPILLVSIIDDLSPLRALPKFAAHFAGASLAVILGVRLGEQVTLFGEHVYVGWVAIPISILWLVGVTNAFNIVDGLDGLSAGLALVSALSLAATALFVSHYGLAVLALVLAGALAGFLPFNVFPAKVFLGDSGATAIGFVLACLAVRGGSTLSSGLAILAPILVLGLPIAETLVSMARRLVRGLRDGRHMGLFEADAGHFHHRLLALGLDQRRAVLVLYAAAVTLALTGFLSLFLSHKKAAIVLLTMIAAAVIALSRLGYDEFAILRRGDLLRVYDVPVLSRNLFGVFIDLTIVVFAIYAAFGLKYDDWFLATNRTGTLWLLSVMPPVSLACFWIFGMYRRVWRFATVEDLVTTSSACTAAVVGTAVVSFLSNPATPPLTWFITAYLLMFMGLGGTRGSYRLLAESRKRARGGGDAVLIYGAGRQGASVIRELLSRPDNNMRPVGFIDDSPARAGKVFNGFPVLGDLEALERLVRSYRVQGVIVATSKVPDQRLLTVATVCERCGVWMKQFHVTFEQTGADTGRFPLTAS